VIATLINPTNPPSVEEARSLEAAAAPLGQRLLILQASTLGQMEDAFATMRQQQVRALIVSSDPFFFSERVKLVVLMARDALPTIFADRTAGASRAFRSRSSAAASCRSLVHGASAGADACCSECVACRGGGSRN
jgi:DNA-binding LacI/PurR family transcriptional regulator